MVTIWNGWYWHLVSALIAMSGALATLSDRAIAQITPDGTLPNNSIVTPQGNTSIIDGGTTAGGNLFHSFEQFSVPTGGEASFNNAPDIQNILSRVTGGSISNIEGLLRANGKANLFLLNPNGIMFGPQATLNIGGSFVGSTASAVNFADGRQFSATAPTTTPVLTVNVPVGLQYGGTAGGIQVRESILQVQTGRTLALIGGNVSVEGGRNGHLHAQGGRVDLGGVAGAGTVGLNVDSNNLLVSFPHGVARADVSLTNGAFVNVAAGGGGSIAVNARNVDILGGSRLFGGILSSQGSVDPQAGDITLNATGTITVAGSSSRISNRVNSDTVGKGGNINIQAGSISLTDGVVLTASTLGKGDAGNIFVQANDSVSLANSSYIFSNVEAGAEGNGGIVDIKAGSLSLTNGAQIQALLRAASNGLPGGRGNGGKVVIDVRDPFTVSGSSAVFTNMGFGAEGKGGDINITTGSLSLTDGATLTTSTRGQGDAGSVIINAREQVTFDRGYAFSSVEAGAEGKGGDINITTGSLSIRDGARLNASTSGQGNAGSVIINAREQVTFDGVGSNGSLSAALSNVEERAIGNAGDINITAGAISVTNDAQLESRTRGWGDAGSVIINARDTVSFNRGYAFSSVEAGAEGKGGNINIMTGSLSLTDGAALTTSTSGHGGAGSLNIEARDTVSFDRGYAVASVRAGGEGDGGIVDIKAGSLSLTNGAQIQALLLSASNELRGGRRNGGKVVIDVSKFFTVSGSSGVITGVGFGAEGNGGDINVKTGSLSLTDGAILTASTYGRGDAGNLNINARDTVSFDRGYAFSSVEAGGEGDGGIIDIKAGSLSLTNSGALRVNTGGQGNSGKINIQAEQISLNSNAAFIGDVDPTGQGRGGEINLDVKGAILLTGGSLAPTGESTRITIGVLSEGIGSGGDLIIKAGSLVLTDGAIIKVSNQGQGPAGNIKVDADVVDISGSVPDTGLPSGLFTSTTNTGRAGDILVDTHIFRVADGAALSARSTGHGQGGNIKVNATSSFEAVNGGQLVTSTFGQGQAGNIFVNATDWVTVSGSDPNYANRIAKFPSDISLYVANAITETGAASGLFANTEADSTGLGGGITITTGQLVIQDGAQVNVSSRGWGNAGELRVEADSLWLENQGRLLASTASGEGGNIDLQVQDLILMRGNSFISAEAGGTGNGGNITISNSFIVAVPSENNDIFANAIQGQGGNIFITTQGIYGLEYRSNLTLESDISASSQFGVSGSVEINNPDVDPTQKLVELPAALVDASNQIATGCAAGGENEFIITGRGGLPPNPRQVLSSNAVQVEWVELDAAAENRASVEWGAREQRSQRRAGVPPVEATGVSRGARQQENSSAPPHNTVDVNRPVKEIVEAQGWIADDNGNITLVADAQTTTPYSSWQKPVECRQVGRQ